jgi:hypothetical protein
MRVTRIRDGKATAYTVGVDRIDPDENPELEPAGFYSEREIYAVFTPGEMVADYDIHRIARSLPGDADWVVDALRDLDYDELDAPEPNP